MPLPEGAYYLYQSFLVQLEHRASAAAPFGGIWGSSVDNFNNLLMCFRDRFTIYNTEFPILKFGFMKVAAPFDKFLARSACGNDSIES